jgi:hypothetical protein
VRLRRENAELAVRGGTVPGVVFHAGQGSGEDCNHVRLRSERGMRS